MKSIFDIKGMSCSACSAAVERAVRKLDGVNEVSVSLLANEMTLDYDESALTPKAVCAAVKKAGYRASLRDGAGKGGETADSGVSDSFTPVKTRLIVSVCFLLPLMYISMGGMLGLPLPPFFTGGSGSGMLALTEFLLCLPVMYVNRKFYIGGFSALARLSPNMDSLVACGSAASVIYGISSLYIILSSLGKGDMSSAEKYAHDLYFESAAMILTLVTVGKLLEERSKNRTGEAIKKLMALAPDSANVERDGTETKIKCSEIREGDIIVLRTGERAPADGTVISGHALLDESALTGEPIPAEKSEGGNILSASVNTSGIIRFRADRVGERTTLAQITELVRGAAASKAPAARLADRIAGIFVPAVMGIALVTAVIWLICGYDIGFALTRAVSVLVISCPCALGLATPVAITAAAGRCASKGILIRSAAALEALAGVDTAVFDKTGTLTEGKPKVTSVYAAVSEDILCGAALALERESTHPLADAVRRYCEDRADIMRFELSGFSETAGKGVCAVLDGKKALGGNASFMEENGVVIPGTCPENEGTPVYFALDGSFIGAMFAADTLREGSAEAVKLISAQGINTVMLTGDTEKAAGMIASAAGIDSVRAGVLPADKADNIGKLRMEGHRVVMIGDGINDSPALAAADAGIAVGSGSDIAVDSAGIVLMKNDMRGAAEAIRFSKLTLRNIRQNLFWAFFYNVICIPVAAGALYVPFGIALSPMLAAAAMSCSSLFVVTNALRLCRK